MELDIHVMVCFTPPSPSPEYLYDISNKADEDRALWKEYIFRLLVDGYLFSADRNTSQCQTFFNQAQARVRRRNVNWEGAGCERRRVWRANMYGKKPNQHWYTASTPSLRLNMHKMYWMLYASPHDIQFRCLSKKGLIRWEGRASEQPAQCMANGETSMDLVIDMPNTCYNKEEMTKERK